MRIDLPHPELFSSIFELLIGKKLNYPVSGICIDSRIIKKGDLFFAIGGQNSNGHEFLSSVYEKGGSAAIVKYDNKDIQLQQLLVLDPVETLCLLAKEWRRNYDIPIIAITGSNGKTSTKELLRHVLSCRYKVHATSGNQNTVIGLSLNLLQISDFHEASILEIGASAIGEIKTLSKIAEPTHGLITNIASAHLEGFGSIENIAREKSELFKYLRQGVSFVNLADPYISKINLNGKKVTFGLSPSCDFSGDIFQENNGDLTLILNSNVIPTSSHNLSFIKNIIAVSSIAVTIGLKWSELNQQIGSFEHPNGRCNVINKNNFTIIDDTYNANLTSSLASLDYLKAYSGNGRKIFVFGDMYELGKYTKKQHHQVGIKCSELALDLVYTVGEHSKHTNSAISEKIKNEHFFSKEKLIMTLKNEIKSGDVVLLKGSRGMAMETIIEGVFKI